MMKPNTLIAIMFMILIINMLTTKTSIMCMNLMTYTMLMSMILSMKIKMTPIPFIMFLTMIGGLMIIFLYLTATLWTKKESLTLKTKMMIISTAPMPLYLALAPNSEYPLEPYINIFNPNSNKMMILLIIILMILLVFMIEIHMKMNSTFRQKLKIWG